MDLRLLTAEPTQEQKHVAVTEVPCALPAPHQSDHRGPGASLGTPAGFRPLVSVLTLGTFLSPAIKCTSSHPHVHHVPGRQSRPPPTPELVTPSSHATPNARPCLSNVCPGHTQFSEDSFRDELTWSFRLGSVFGGGEVITDFQRHP